VERRATRDNQSQCGRDGLWPFGLTCKMRAPRTWYEVRLEGQQESKPLPAGPAAA